MLLAASTLPLGGIPTTPAGVAKTFLAPLPGRLLQHKEVPTRYLITCLLSFLPSYSYLLASSLAKKYQKISFVAFVAILLLAIMSTPENTKLCDFLSTNNNDFISTPIAPPATSAESYEIKAALLNLVMKDQFSRNSNEDAAAHLNTFVELCDMQKTKDVDNDIIKLKLFPFSLRDRAKEWLVSLPKNSIDSWTKCKDAFIGKYFPP